MNNIKVSIIVPSYNIEAYIEKCLLSIIKQSLKDIEIICVDCNSTDDTAKIIKQYAQNDNRIRLISTPVRDMGTARNLGIDVAKGEYLGFVDGDDFVSSQMFEKLYKLAKKDSLDICFCRTTTYNNVTGEMNSDMWYYALYCFDGLKKKIFDHQDTRDFMEQIAVMPYNKIYRRAMIEQSKIRFPQELLFEDEVFFYNAYLHAKRSSLQEDKDMYYYRVARQGSSSNVEEDTDFSDIVKIFKLIREIFHECGYYEEYKVKLANTFVGLGLWRYILTSENHRQNFYTALKADTEELLKDQTIKDNIQEHIKKRVDNLLNSTSRQDFEKKENYKKNCVILSFYNEENSMEEKILSVINHKDFDFKKDLQLILVDDGSQDKTGEICKKYMDLYPENVLFLSQAHQGPSKAFQLGGKYAMGKYCYSMKENGELVKII